MDDIKEALRMEEEALRRMKKEQIKGGSFKHTKQKRRESTPSTKKDAEDLISFSDSSFDASHRFNMQSLKAFKTNLAQFDTEESKKSNSWNDLLQLYPDSQKSFNTNFPMRGQAASKSYHGTHTSSTNFTPAFIHQMQLKPLHQTTFQQQTSIKAFAPTVGINRCSSSPHMHGSLDPFNMPPIPTNLPIKNIPSSPSPFAHSPVKTLYPQQWSISANTSPKAFNSSPSHSPTSFAFYGSTSNNKDTTPKENTEIDNVFERWLTDNEQNEKPSSSVTPVTSPIDLSEWDPLEYTKSDTGASSDAVFSDESNNLNKTMKISPTVSLRFSDSFSQDENYNGFASKKEEHHATEMGQFIDAVVEICRRHPHSDHESNKGYLISPTMPKWMNYNDQNEDSIKLKITSKRINEPVVFSCAGSSAVEHILSQALCIAFEDMNEVAFDDYVFKVAGRVEYLLNDSILGSYEYVQDCKKYDTDVSLELVKKSEVNKAFQRMENDENKRDLKTSLQEIFVNLHPVKLSRENNQILLDRFYTESGKLMSLLNMGTESAIVQQADRIVQSVKACCMVMCGIETRQLHDQIENLQHLIQRHKPELTNKLSNDNDMFPLSSSSTYQEPMKHYIDPNKVSKCTEGILSAQLYIVETLCKSIEIDALSDTDSPTDNVTLSTDVQELFTVNFVSLHRLPHLWHSMYDEYYMSCTLYHGDKELHRQITTLAARADKSFNSRVHWNKWVSFPLRVSELPRETRLNIVLYGTGIPSEGKTSSDKTPKQLAWINIPIYKHNRLLHQGASFAGMWIHKRKKRENTHRRINTFSTLKTESLILHYHMFKEDEKQKIIFPNIQLPERRIREHADLDATTEAHLKRLLCKNPFTKFKDEDRYLLWQHRFSKKCFRRHKFFPRILQCVKKWSPENLQEIYQYVASWDPLKPLEALQFLNLRFPDTVIREQAVQWINEGSDDEIHDCLVQLTQALNYELHHDNALGRFLLRRAMRSVRVALKLYWLLNESPNCDRFKLYLETLKVICGAKVLKEFDKETYITKMIHRSAEAVKVAKDGNRMQILAVELDKVEKRVNNRSFRLPTNPSFSANHIDVQNSSYFTSNAIPLKIVFKSSEVIQNDFAEMKLMYKVGDDLRQDVLTMQLVSLMDKMWLSEGLDLKMITFSCLAVGEDRGWVEIIPNSSTLREIQSKYGLTGSFKDRPIAEWLQMHNPTGISYSKAEENFMLSCAGYCVATYILGICDRHNDNIMLRQSGHIFHIDFARFLGHAQMFGNIKRDRTPFVLTSDMAYVINGGDRKSSKFHDFIDICCSAFNIIRQNSQILINMLSLMVDSGIPELNSDMHLKYVYDALKPEASDSEATTMFTRLIETSLSSSFTKLNFFIHNLAQLKFSGNENDKNTLSFASKTHTAAADGIITEANVVGYQKQYNPEKYYVFCIRLKRERRAAESYVFRTFEEFQELHAKLSMNFSSYQLPSFPAKVIVGRSQIKQVSERRKAQLNAYLHQLLRGTKVVAQCDLIYTFFQPLLRDEQESTSPSNAVQKPITARRSSSGGEIKMSLHHKNEALFIMIMHCRNLVSSDGADPDPYVKTYLRPDVGHETKRKTKVVRKTLHPTFNEMIVYRTSLINIQQKTLHVSVWNYEQFHENDFLGSVLLPLDQIDLTTETTKWYKLMAA